MSYPYRENLEVLDDSSNKMIRCSRCAQMLCRLGEDWKKTCTRRMFPPVRAGALMNDLVGHYLLEKLYCPSCGVLLDSNLLEVSNPRSTS
jgi:acetone carboxylase gamma subunit